MQSNKIKKILKISDNPVIISELGINHQGKIELAKKMVDAIYDAGGRIVKNQSHDLEDEMSEEAKNIKPPNADISIYDVIKRNILSKKNELKLKNYVEKKGMVYLSTPFSFRSAEKLNKEKIKIFKIGSGEFNNLHYLNKILKFKKPLILSTGMQNENSIQRTVNFLKKKNASFMLLHCISEYPVKKSFQLNFIRTLKQRYKNILVGYSDHSDTIYPSILAMGLGAILIEKHFTLSKKINGPDISSSMNKSELKNLINISKMINFREKRFVTQTEKKVSRFAFASVVSKTKISKGSKLNFGNIDTKRPGTGDFLHYDINKLLGKTVKNNIQKNVQLKKNDI